MAYEMSIEVLDGEFPAYLWMDAHGDSLVEAALQCGVIEWRWQFFDWGVVLEIDFAEESGWERFRASTAVQAALDSVPDRFSGLLIYRGRGGSSSPRMPRKPLPRTGAGAVSLEFPDEWVFEPAPAPPVLQGWPGGRGLAHHLWATSITRRVPPPGPSSWNTRKGSRARTPRPNEE